MDRCANCVMPNIDSLLILDKNGKCNHCLTHKPINYIGEEILLELLKKYKNQSSQFDCIVNISGGRDSAYTLLKAVKDYKMRVLAVNYQNPFVDPIAEQNIQKMVKILGVKLIQFQLKDGLHEMFVKNNFLVWLKKPDPALVPVICVGCKIIWPRIIHIAKKNNIKCIINGGNPFEYSSFKKILLGVNENSGLSQVYSKNLVGLIKRVTQNLGYLKPRFLPATIGGYLFGNQYAIGSRILGRSIKRMDIFHYIPWDENEVLGRIQRELDWQYPQQYKSTWRFDCRLSHLKDLMYKYSLGMTEKDDFYSIMVREKQISREDALKRLDEENKIHFDIIDEILYNLGIESLDLKKILNFKELDKIEN